MSMSEQAKKARREYLRSWKSRNPKRVKQYQKNYWEKVAQKQMEKSAN